ncbi:hypothetical protein BN1007_30073 [Klebsiella variicola]|nr:hypothetical protein BN1007_30073 [Klebsiella variicola]
MHSDPPVSESHAYDLLIRQNCPAISMHLACLYTTARLFINCPNKTKWENTGEVRKVSIDPCSLLRTAGSRLDFWPLQIHRAATPRRRNPEGCAFADPDAGL